MFFKEVSYAQQHCIYLIKNTVKTVLWNIIEILFKNVKVLTFDPLAAVKKKLHAFAEEHWITLYNKVS